MVLQGMRPGPDDGAILEKCLEDFEQGFATCPLTHQELMRKLQGREIENTSRR